ncbi:hypothetical protein GCM10011508_08260 [Flavobacterium lutivivi]|nr:hypothetical protein GCM10011508_08260 [Flavobacterium lutivivi]
MRVVKVNFPEKSILSNEQFDYFDCYQGKLINTENISVVDVCKSFFSTAPNWVDKLFYLRNRVVSLFGLKVPKSEKDKTAILAEFKGEEGEQLGLFKVLERRENEIVLGENDKHLNFKVSILLDKLETNSKSITISTIVVFNNWFGKLYFLPVKPFHKLIVPIMLKSILKDLEKNNER